MKKITSTKTTGKGAVKKSERITVVGFVGRLHDFDYGSDGDYGYSFTVTTSNAPYDVTLFGDARGHVEGSIFVPEAKTFQKVSPLKNGDYVEVTGTYTTSTFVAKDKSEGTNHRVAINFPFQVTRLERPKSANKRVRFVEGTTQSQAPAAA